MELPCGPGKEKGPVVEALITGIAATHKDAYPLPRIDDSLDALAGSVFFSTLDLKSGYWQVPLDQDAQKSQHL